jgi:hypothetical protein
LVVTVVCCLQRGPPLPHTDHPQRLYAGVALEQPHGVHQVAREFRQIDRPAALFHLSQEKSNRGELFIDSVSQDFERHLPCSRDKRISSSMVAEVWLTRR